MGQLDSLAVFTVVVPYAGPDQSLGVGVIMKPVMRICTQVFPTSWTKVIFIYIYIKKKLYQVVLQMI